MAQPKIQRHKRHPRPIQHIKNEQQCQLHQKIVQFFQDIDKLPTAREIRRKQWQPAPISQQLPIS